MSNGTRDLRPHASLRVFGRRVSHWTPRYLYYRSRSILRQHLVPDNPSITPDAVALLSSLLRPVDRGAEWGSGNSTVWFAKHTARLTSFETNDAYFPQVQHELRSAGLTNVDYLRIPFEDSDDEDQMHRSEWVRQADRFADESLDYALVDSSPRGCLCMAIAPKLKPGGVLILDNANWYIPPPPSVRPPVVNSVTVPLGAPGSAWPGHRCWSAFVATLGDWRSYWSSDGVQMTLILIKASSR